MEAFKSILIPSWRINLYRQLIRNIPAKVLKKSIWDSHRICRIRWFWFRPHSFGTELTLKIRRSGGIQASFIAEYCGLQILTDLELKNYSLRTVNPRLVAKIIKKLVVFGKLYHINMIISEILSFGRTFLFKIQSSRSIQAKKIARNCDFTRFEQKFNDVVCKIEEFHRVEYETQTNPELQNQLIQKILELPIKIS